MKSATLAALSTLIFSTLPTSAIPTAGPSQLITKRVSAACPNGACPDDTVPIVQFNAYDGWDCLSTGNYYAVYSYEKSQASDTCHQLGNGSPTVQSVSQTFGDFKCQLTVYMTPDCSDSGVPIGAPPPKTAPGCFSGAGGIKGYKVQCPWW